MLNDPPLEDADSQGVEAGEELQRRVLDALVTHTTPEGRVDYRQLRRSSEFREVVAHARQLQRVDVARLGPRPARLAFWINVYNALAVHGVIALGVRQTVWEVFNFFGRVSYRIGGVTLSLDAIEHGVLRGNRRRVLPPWRPLGGGDPRLALTVEPVDPRIHFALTCGARSCPPTGVYRAAATDAQLDLATRNFVNQEVVVDGQGRVACSKIFKWYRGDFGSEADLVRFLLRHLDDGPVKAALAAGARPCRAFTRYSWALQHPSVE